MQSQQSMHSSSFMSHHSSSAVDEQQLLGQSMTVNTKEALSAVQDLWQSPTERIMPSPLTHRMPSENCKFSFNIHMDSSMTQNVNSKLPHHQQQQQQSFSGSVQPFNDQENNQHYHNSFSNQQQQNSFGNQSMLQNSYHYSLQVNYELYNKKLTLAHLVDSIVFLFFCRLITNSIFTHIIISTICNQ